MTDQLITEFEDCRLQLRSYILRITASAEDTEDIIQDTYLKAHANINSFQGKSSVKTWLFAIASNLAKDHRRAKQRWPENVTDICRGAALSNPDFLQEMMQIRTTSPQGNFEIKEHITFCFACVSKSLSLEQQLVLLLKEVYAFRVKEIAEIIRASEAMTKYYLRQARSTMIKIFDHRCALINKEGACHQCTELNGIFNPQQQAQEELLKIKMVREAEDQDQERLFTLRTKIVQEIDPYTSGAAELQQRHLRHNRKVMEDYLKEDNS